MGRFRIKITSWWASPEWVHFKYSTNGIFWKRVYTCEYDIMDEYYYLVPLTVQISSADEYINKFKSIDDIRKYEKEQLEYGTKNNKWIDDQNNKKQARIKETYKRLG